jgi:hypothetical protein
MIGIFLLILPLLLVAVLDIAPVLNDEMAYASNSPRGAGATGGRATSSSTAACNQPTTCSDQTLPGVEASFSAATLLS